MVPGKICGIPGSRRSWLFLPIFDSIFYALTLFLIENRSTADIMIDEMDFTNNSTSSTVPNVLLDIKWEELKTICYNS